MNEPLKWVRRKEEKDYVAVDDDTTYCIWGGTGAWDIATLDADNRMGYIRNPETNRATQEFHSLDTAKLAIEVLRACGAEALFEHVVNAHTRLQGGGWGGHPRTYIGKASCVCGWEGGNDSGVREARQSAAWHLHQKLDEMMRPEKVT